LSQHTTSKRLLAVRWKLFIKPLVLSGSRVKLVICLAGFGNRGFLYVVDTLNHREEIRVRSRWASTADSVSDSLRMDKRVQIFFQVRIAVLIPIAVAIGAIAGIESASKFPFVWHSISIVVARRKRAS
jgi:hypothetical protein